MKHSAIVESNTVMAEKVKPIIIFDVTICFPLKGIVFAINAPSPSFDTASMLDVLELSISFVINSATATPTNAFVILACILPMKAMSIGGSTIIIPACTSILLCFSMLENSFLTSAALTDRCLTSPCFFLFETLPSPSYTLWDMRLNCHIASNVPTAASASTIPINAIA